MSLQQSDLDRLALARVRKQAYKLKPNKTHTPHHTNHKPPTLAPSPEPPPHLTPTPTLPPPHHPPPPHHLSSDPTHNTPTPIAEYLGRAHPGARAALMFSSAYPIAAPLRFPGSDLADEARMSITVGQASTPVRRLAEMTADWFDEYWHVERRRDIVSSSGRAPRR